ncbi:MAG: DUF4430 domain-containing protein [Solirubrobacteraceae bacterium]
MRLRRATVVACVLLAALAPAGCGLGAGRTPGGVTISVTRDFGASRLLASKPIALRGEETIMSALMRNYAVSTRYGGGFVESINGYSGGHSHGAPIDWFYYVNGVEATKGAASTVVHPGDSIWWDLHDWSATEEVPAVVGAFPEPFLNGSEGKRLPVRVECASVTSEACRLVMARMRALGIPAGLAGLSAAGETPDTLGVAVGPWSAVRSLVAASAIERGPRASGVFAQIAAGGQSLSLLNESGSVVSTLHGSAGLLAAVRYPGEEPLWLVTGTNADGADLAARALDAATLHDRFAIAVSARGTAIALPVGGPARGAGG